METPQKAVEELRRILALAEEEARRDPRLKCELSGRCCRFKEAGHELFVTRLEFEEMERWGGAGGRGDGACPWLQGTLCGNRQGRALACRTYFCSDEGAAADLTERWHAEIRRLHDRLGIPYDYRRLADHAGPRAPPVP